VGLRDVLGRFLHFASVFTHTGESYTLKEAKRDMPHVEGENSDC
jgi:hypothetical protein